MSNDMQHHIQQETDDICSIPMCLICAAGRYAPASLRSARRSVRLFQAGDIVVCAGEPMNFVGSLISGFAILTMRMPDGRRQITGVVQPSDVIGWPGRPTAGSTVTAKTDLSMCCLDRASFEAVMRRHPLLNQRLLDLRLAELEAARDWLGVLGGRSAREKVARLLTLIALRTGGPEMEPASGQVSFEIPMNRSEMADCLGMAPETVTRCLTSLREDGLIAITGTVNVQADSLDRLRSAAGFCWGEKSDD